MPRPAKDVTEAELAVLRALWEGGPSTIRRLAEGLYPGAGGGASRHATVQKLLERLEGKGCVARDRGASVHVFEAAVGRDELIGRRLRSLAEALCGGSLTPLLTHLVEDEPMTEAERRALRGLVERLDRARRQPE